VEKCGRTGQATDGNMAHAHCVLDIHGVPGEMDKTSGECSLC